MSSRRAVNAGLARPTVIWGAVAFLACLIGFGAIGWSVSQPGIPPIDAAVTDGLHGLANPTLDALMIAVTTLGSSVVLAAVVGSAAVLLGFRFRRPEALFIAVAFVGTLALNDMLKLFFQRPRPGFDWAEVWPETGFPSGHAMNSLVSYVALALVIRRVGARRSGILAVALAMLLATAIGVSRVYLGAHWLTDVIGGYLAGTLWLLVLVAASAVVPGLLRRGRSDATAGDGELPQGSRPSIARRDAVEEHAEPDTEDDECQA